MHKRVLQAGRNQGVTTTFVVACLLLKLLPCLHVVYVRISGQ
jgi:hypothetical protein